MSCTMCDLHKTAQHVLVPFRGQYRQPKLMFVGIAPGPQEDAQGRCFVGPSGELLSQVLNELHIPHDAVAYDNVVHCFPGDQFGQIRDPSLDECITCSPFLWNMIKMVDPAVIVPLGSLAYRVVSGYSQAYITEAHGLAEKIRVAGKERYVVGTFHPSAALRQNRVRGIPQSYYDSIVRDIKYAWDHANGEYFLPKNRVINDTDEAIAYIEHVVELYQTRQINFAALDTEGPQIQLKQKDRKKLGIEVQSSDMWNPAKRTVGVSISYIPPGCASFRDVEGTFIVMDHPESNVDYQRVSWALKWAFDRRGKVCLPTAFHNQKYDDQWCRQKHDFQAICYHDTMLGSFVYHGHSISHGLGNISHKLLKYENYKDLPGEYLESLPMDQRSFYNVPLSVLGPYAAIDAAATASLTILEKDMLRRSNQEMITSVLTEATVNFADIEYSGVAIDYEKHQQHMENYPKMMEEARLEVMALPMVQAYIQDRMTIWTFDKKGKPRAPNKKFVFNCNSPDHKYDLLYRYYNFPIEYAEETKASQDHEDDADYVQVFSTNENSRHMMTLHVRDEKYEGKCTCQCYVPGWDTFGEDSAKNLWRTWDYYVPVNFNYYGIDPHVEGYKFLVKIRFWGKLRKVYNDYIKKIEHYFRPIEWQREQGIPENLRIVNNNYILHWVKCVARGSQIETDEGKIPIEQLYERFTTSEFVCMPKILDGVIYRYPLEVVYSGIKSSVTIVAKDTWGDVHTLTGSHHHMIRVERSFLSCSGWKRLDRFVVGDRVVISVRPCQTREALITDVSSGEAEFFDISMDAAHDTEELVECRICGHQGQMLTKHLKVRHDLTAQQYLGMYPGSPLSSYLWNSDKSQRLSSTLRKLWSTEEFRDFIKTDSRQVAAREQFKRPDVRKLAQSKRSRDSYQSPKQKEAASRTITRLNLAGNGVFKKQRRYPYTCRLGRSLVFKSSFEISYAFYLDSIGASWEYEPQTLRYQSSKGFRGRYTPDFIVDGKLIEVKPEWKHEATREFLNTNFADYSIQIVGENELTALGAFQLYYDSTRVAAVGATTKNQFYGLKLKYGYVANGFICHNTGRLCTRDFAIHTIPWHSDARRLFVSRWKNTGGLMLSADYCFTSDTSVKLLDGRDLTFKELTEKLHDEKFWVYSIDDHNNLVPGLAHSPRITGHNAPIYTVTLDSGESIRCTGNHLWMLRDGSYQETVGLRPGDSLMPLYTKKSSSSDGDSMCGYEKVHTGSGVYKFTHAITGRSSNTGICDICGVELPDRSHRYRHHKNFDKHDNSPTNIQHVTRDEHTKIHNEHFDKTLLVYIRSARGRNISAETWRRTKKKFWNSMSSNERREYLDSLGIRSETARQSLSRSVATHWEKSSLEERSIRCRRISDSCKGRVAHNKGVPHSDLTKSLIADKQIAAQARRSLKDRIAVSREMISAKVKKFASGIQGEINEDSWESRRNGCRWIPKWDTAKSILTESNHKVVSVEFAGYEDVYDLTVDKFHNFALTAGVFVHNSQLELRVAAAIGKDEKLIQAYHEGKDVHRVTASNVYKVPENEVTQAMRRYSKTMSFRLIYGGGADAIADETGLTKREAQKMIDAFLETYSGIKHSIEFFHDHVKKFGFVKTPMNRIFYLPDVFDENRSKQAGALRDSQNYPIQCFVASTRIKLLNGTKPEIQDLVGRDKFWVYSFDDSRKKIVPGLGKNCRKTGEQVPVYDVILDNGEVVRSTGDHHWLLKAGGYCSTLDLFPGTSLEPLVTGQIDGYETIWDSYEKKTISTHKLIAEEWYGRALLPNEVVHHASFDKKNNEPTKLWVMDRNRHISFHAQWIREETLKHFPGGCPQRAREYLNVDAAICAKRVATRHSPDSRFQKRLQDYNKCHPNLRPDITFDAICDLVENGKIKLSEHVDYFQSGPTVVKDRVCARGFENWTQFIFLMTGSIDCRNGDYGLPTSMRNHKVVSVTFVGYEDVYDFEVEKYHNFALDAGVFVHNSSSSDITMTAINMVCRELPKTKMHSLIWAMIHDAIESDLYPGELLPYYRILKHAMEEQVCELFDWLCVPMVAEFELGVRWDGALTVKELDDEHMVLKGRRGFYDETLEHLARGYEFESKIKKEVYTGTHRPCKGDGEVDAVTNVCKKCQQVVNPDTDLDYGETLILRKSYEGDSGGNTEVTCEIAWRQHMSW